MYRLRSQGRRRFRRRSKHLDPRPLAALGLVPYPGPKMSAINKMLLSKMFDRGGRRALELRIAPVHGFSPSGRP